MRLEASGHPLHTRCLSIVVTARADGKLDVDGVVLDLRKRGFVPVAGDLQGAGIIHDMRLGGVVDPGRGCLERLGAEQRSVAFEPSAGRMYHRSIGISDFTRPVTSTLVPSGDHCGVCPSANAESSCRDSPPVAGTT